MGVNGRRCRPDGCLVGGAGVHGYGLVRAGAGVVAAVAPASRAAAMTRWWRPGWIRTGVELAAVPVLDIGQVAGLIRQELWATLVVYFAVDHEVVLRSPNLAMG